ncbi:MAG: sulfatase, partial [Planctomycetaceae bacterium]
GAYGREACSFIERKSNDPFLLVLSFNALHIPLEAQATTLRRFAHLDVRLQRFAAVLTECDDAIGAVMSKLRSLSLEENTLVFFVSDNGSPLGIENSGMRGGKGDLFEGGLRVPFIVQWKGRIPAGRVLREPVVQLDILPTAAAAAGIDSVNEWQLDGLNLLPLLEGATQSLDREAIYWRYGNRFAVRQGDWKLVKANQAQPPLLFNLATDLGETSDLSATQPDKAKHLLDLWSRWNTQMQPYRWVDPRWNGEPRPRVGLRRPTVAIVILVLILAAYLRQVSRSKPNPSAAGIQ